MQQNKPDNPIFNTLFSWLITILLVVQVILMFFLIIQIDKYVKLTLKSTAGNVASKSEISYAGNISIDDDPTKGNNKESKVTIIEFADFQCPYCGEANKIIDKIINDNPDSILYVFRDFPLPMHKNAYQAAVAANCAGDQGKYWEMHEALFGDQQHLEETDLIEKAQQIGLEMTKFGACMQSGKFKAEIDHDISEGKSYGIGGTPTFFVNGYWVSSNSLEMFVTALIGNN
jgi:protein-disulfide isomerase